MCLNLSEEEIMSSDNGKNRGKVPIPKRKPKRKPKNGNTVKSKARKLSSGFGSMRKSRKKT